MVSVSPNERSDYIRAILYSPSQFRFNLLVFGFVVAFYAWRFPKWIQLQADGTLVVVCYWRNWVFQSIESVQPNPNLCLTRRHIRTDFTTGFKNRVLVKFSSLSSSTVVLVSPEDLKGFLEVANRLSLGNHVTEATRQNHDETNLECLEAGK